MGTQQIRVPRQQRSIEKRNKIIEAGYQLFCEKGYHNTNTAEIARVAGVSTGIVYSYFKDKKDIFLCAIEVYTDSIIAPIYELIAKVEKPIDLYSVMKACIANLIETHTMNKSVHEEMVALSHTDQEISELFCKYQAQIALNIVNQLEKNDFHPTNSFEKAHLIVSIIENLLHEIVYHQHEYLNYDAMTEVAIKAVIDMINS